jgi:nitronate monooxygenase
MKTITTPLSQRLGLRYPIIAAPMFLISNKEMLVAAAEAGILASMPSLNCRTTQELRDTLSWVRERTSGPFGINLTIKLTDPARLEADVQACLDLQVPVLITSYGDPTDIARRAHARGMIVLHDVIRLDHALKAQAAGVDAVIAVAAGAGGHAGTISPYVLVPWLKQHLHIPVIAAGCIATGQQMAASFALGAEAVYMGTRFIASSECGAELRYKQMVVGGSPDDLVYTNAVSGVHANFLKATLPKETSDAASAQAAIQQHGAKRWKDIWSAGQGIALAKDIKPIAEIVAGLVAEYQLAVSALPRS